MSHSAECVPATVCAWSRVPAGASFADTQLPDLQGSRVTAHGTLHLLLREGLDMKPFERILCAVDFSDTSREALRYAAMLTRCGSGELHIAHATHFELPLYFTHGQMEELRQQPEHSRSAAAAAVSRFGAEAAAGDDHVHLIDGPAAEAIIALAGRLGAGLIVMGTHGRTGLNASCWARSPRK